MSAASVIAISRLKVDALNVDAAALRTKTDAVNAVLIGEKQSASAEKRRSYDPPPSLPGGLQAWTESPQ
jgi:hypothetical protein